MKVYPWEDALREHTLAARQAERGERGVQLSLPCVACKGDGQSSAGTSGCRHCHGTGSQVRQARLHPADAFALAVGPEEDPARLAYEALVRRARTVRMLVPGARVRTRATLGGTRPWFAPYSLHEGRRSCCDGAVLMPLPATDGWWVVEHGDARAIYASEELDVIAVGDDNRRAI
jgi:hypothetical protein